MVVLKCRITFCGSCAVFYLGFGALEHRKKYCNKIKQISTENSIAIFFICRNFIRASKLIHLLSSPNKTLRKAAVSSWCRTTLLVYYLISVFIWLCSGWVLLYLISKTISGFLLSRLKNSWFFALFGILSDW